MDAWVWTDHGHVFANAQPANVVLFGIHVAVGDFTTAARPTPTVEKTSDGGTADMVDAEKRQVAKLVRHF
jgi:hypothetical protein